MQMLIVFWSILNDEVSRKSFMSYRIDLVTYFNLLGTGYSW